MNSLAYSILKWFNNSVNSEAANINKILLKNTSTLWSFTISDDKSDINIQDN